jgi:Uncharacterised nucleotidyltransferase
MLDGGAPHTPGRAGHGAARAQAAYLLRTHALEKLCRALEARALDVLLVKGAALAITHYAEPWTRDMADIDVIVRPGTRDHVVAALAAHGFAVIADAARPLSSDAFGETCLSLACGAATVAFEVHTRLDKLVARPVDHAAIFARSAPAPGLPRLRLPADEDHVLLLALHAAGHDFRHPPAGADLALLLTRGVDEEAVLDRARRWRLTTVLFVMLTLLRESGSERVPDRLLRATAPRGLRRALIDRYRARLADEGAPLGLGWPWIARQTVLRDDLPAWTGGLVRYAGTRALETALARLARGDAGLSPPAP